MVELMELKLIWNIIIANVYNLYDNQMITHYCMSFDRFCGYRMSVAWGVEVISRKMWWHPSI